MHERGDEDRIYLHLTRFSYYMDFLEKNKSDLSNDFVKNIHFIIISIYRERKRFTLYMFINVWEREKRRTHLHQKYSTKFRDDSLFPREQNQWRRRESNPRPPACEADALPTELRPHLVPCHIIIFLVNN